jgi:ferredoxin
MAAKDKGKKLTRREMLNKLSPLGRVKLDREKCTGCGICARDCPAGALTTPEGDTFRLVFRYGACIACGACVELCPEKALTLERVLEPDSLGEEAVLLEDELVRCSECGQPVGPRSMVEKMRGRVKTVRSDLCISCKARRWNRSF